MLGTPDFPTDEVILRVNDELTKFYKLHGRDVNIGEGIWLISNGQLPTSFDDFNALPERDTNDTGSSANDTIPPFLQDNDETYQKARDCLESILGNYLAEDQTFYRDHFPLELRRPEFPAWDVYGINPDLPYSELDLPLKLTQS